ncbi:MAG: Carboxyl-terminal protease [Candidatus Moranbacteria bacterium GW2011_GWE1_49_15]|nr:MAG: Carboxyl-terminal protease [Candidatus Moranbacteria bacterium GW2011_GWE2_47_10]KKW07069.1 MAG: Carboxyl-terminal protease [Candidatus Moranbacteria bacterium GW2011_GWE1_49_15]
MTGKNPTTFEGYRTTVFLILFLIVGFWVGFEKGRLVGSAGTEEKVSLEGAIIENREGDGKVDFDLFWDVWDLLRDKYVDSESLDAKKLMYGSINGMLQATGDPYTLFLNPEDNKRFNEEIEGSFEGIGAELGVKNGMLTVIAPLEGTPAEKAGLRAGDKIVDINGKSASEMTLEEAVSQIRGPKDTEVVLTIFREGEESTRDIKVQRNFISVKSVKVESMNGGIAHLKISRFGEDTTREFSAALNSAKAGGAKGIVLDLRNNPGGYLDASISVASKMLPKGKIVVIEENADKTRKEVAARGGDVSSEIETVIIINEGSASAAEILAGALEENRENVTLVGKKSFGKGSVQELVRLPQGTAAKITVARWLTPKGNQINEVGISPEVEVELTNEDYENDRDPQLDRAFEIIREKIGG